MKELLHNSIELLVNIIDKLGYLGIFVGMLLESTPVPIPSELIMIPAGIAASKGIVNLYLATFLGILGNVIGAVICYYISLKFGRKIIIKYGKYFFLKEHIINKMQNFFDKHGPISVFIGRLLPGFRHFISIPAGLTQMNIKLFYIYTIIGSSIWTTILSLIGFIVGENQALIEQNLKEISIILFTIIAILTILYCYLQRRN